MQVDNIPLAVAAAAAAPVAFMPSTQQAAVASSLSTVMRERMRQRVATRLTQSASPEQAGSEVELAAATAAAPPFSDALATSIAEAAAAANRVGQNSPPARSNDSSIGDILHQLQQKLGPQYSKPGTASPPMLARASSGSIAPASRPKPAAVAGSGTAGDAAAASSARRHAHQQQLLLTEQQQKVRSKQRKKAQAKEQKAAAFNQLQAAADLELKQRPPTASVSRSKATERSRSSRSIANSQTAAAAAAAGPWSLRGSAEGLGSLPPGVAAVVASTAAPAVVQRQLLRSLASGHGRKLKHLQQLLASAPAAAAAAADPAPASAGIYSSSVAELPAAATAAQMARSSSSSGDGAWRVSAEVLGCVRSHPGLLRLSAAGLEQRLASLQASLGLASKQEVLQVVRWQPRVLSMSEAALQDKVWGLAAALRVPLSSIQSLFVRQPLLFNLSAETLVRKASNLGSSLGLPPQQLWEMLQCKPGVLLFSSAKVSRKWMALKRLAGVRQQRGKCIALQSELAELSPSSVVQLLTASEPRLARLQHVAAVGCQEEASLFRAKFRQYGQWLVQQKKRGAAAGAAAADFGAGGGA
ncbi:hypothetical protein COO60DRAFT_1642975 [Scenedesmus sp. NREL 46B-D3]|nr:hypothetical protein COO60DRAFT_1642975 [Scenedesmus sp. NREL 46B-D3]